MPYLTKEDADRIIQELSRTDNKKIKKIILKINSPKKIIFVRDKPGIKRLLKEAFKQKRSLKIKYYSLSSDEVRFRVIDILNIHNGCIIAYCHLREDERTFVIDRIYSAAILEDKERYEENIQKIIDNLKIKTLQYREFNEIIKNSTFCQFKKREYTSCELCKKLKSSL